MGLESAGTLNIAHISLFAPCMGLERRPPKKSNVSCQFAPCMGLESILIL